jgi:hypothetical protein
MVSYLTYNSLFYKLTHSKANSYQSSGKGGQIMKKALSIMTLGCVLSLFPIATSSGEEIWTGYQRIDKLEWFFHRLDEGERRMHRPLQASILQPVL